MRGCQSLGISHWGRTSLDKIPSDPSTALKTYTYAHFEYKQPHIFQTQSFLPQMWTRRTIRTLIQVTENAWHRRSWTLQAATAGSWSFGDGGLSHSGNLPSVVITDIWTHCFPSVNMKAWSYTLATRSTSENFNTGWTCIDCADRHDLHLSCLRRASDMNPLWLQTTRRSWCKFCTYLPLSERVMNYIPSLKRRRRMTGGNSFEWFLAIKPISHWRHE